MFGFLSNNLFTQHVAQNTSGLSPRLWSRLTGTMMAADGQKRLVLEGDDFCNWGACATSADNHQGYGVYLDAGTSVVQSAGFHGGVIALTQDGTDNDEVWITSGGNDGVLGAISDTAGSDYLMAFESRFKLSSVADDYLAMFVGLAEEGCAAADSKVDDTGVMADKDYIGFDTVHTNGGTAGTNAVLRFVYRMNGQTAQTPIADLATLVAGTWYKVGFLYDPTAVPSRRISVYLNNVENGTYVTATNIAAATFPDGEELAFLAGCKMGSGNAAAMYLDWWGFGQLID